MKFPGDEQMSTKGSAVSDTVYAVDFAHKLRGLNRPGVEAAIEWNL